MGLRAKASGIRLSVEDAAIVKDMLQRGDRQHDIAAYFGVNGGRIAGVAAGADFLEVEAAPEEMLPPPGPYLSGREAAKLLRQLAAARSALAAAEATVNSSLS